LGASVGKILYMKFVFSVVFEGGQVNALIVIDDLFRKIRMFDNMELLVLKNNNKM
jgi:hypothetical protein